MNAFQKHTSTPLLSKMTLVNMPFSLKGFGFQRKNSLLSNNGRDTDEVSNMDSVQKKTNDKDSFSSSDGTSVYSLPKKKKIVRIVG
jgi:hypothetical protein